MKNHSKTDKFASDMRALNNLAMAYLNCGSEEMKAVWKRKWYQMCKVIANKMKSIDDNHELLN